MNHKPIRVLQVFTILNRGGAESMIMNYYRNIDRTKVQFDFLVHRQEKGAFEDEITAMGGKIYRMPPINPLKTKSYKRQLKFFLQNHDYKIIHSHLNAFSKYVLQVAQDVNIPVRIAHSHIALPAISLKFFLSSKMDVLSKFKVVIKNYIKGDVKHYATHFFACEYEAGIWLFGNNNIKEVQIINNAIEVDSFKYNPIESKQIKKELELEGKFVIGHVGRFNMQKNHTFLIDIFHEIVKIKQESVLLLIGVGKLRAVIEKKVKKLNLDDKMRFLGVQKNISYYLQAMDVFLFPSLYEGLPVTLIEAQAAGLKIIASDTIDEQINITGLINNTSLSKSPQEWANIVLKNAQYKRDDVADLVKKNAYDIKQNAKELQVFYLTEFNKIRLI